LFAPITKATRLAPPLVRQRRLADRALARCRQPAGALAMLAWIYLPPPTRNCWRRIRKIWPARSSSVPLPSSYPLLQRYAIPRGCLRADVVRRVARSPRVVLACWWR